MNVLGEVPGARGGGDNINTGFAGSCPGGFALCYKPGCNGYFRNDNSGKGNHRII